MKTSPLSRVLRWSAASVLILGVATWAASGARIGWTQTSVVSIQRDEVTGIDYPVRQPAFRAGVEIPLLALATAGALAAASLGARRLSSVQA